MMQNIDARRGFGSCRVAVLFCLLFAGSAFAGGEGVDQTDRSNATVVLEPQRGVAISLTKYESAHGCVAGPHYDENGLLFQDLLELSVPTFGEPPEAIGGRRLYYTYGELEGRILEREVIYDASPYGWVRTSNRVQWVWDGHCWNPRVCPLTLNPPQRCTDG